MLDQGMINYLRKFATITRGAYTSGATGQQIIGNDPGRFLFLMMGSASAAVGINFGENNQGGPVVYAPVSADGIYVSEDTHPTLITLPIWAYASSPSQTMQWLTCSYEQGQFRRYEHIINRLLRDSGTL